jgi:hypothetical protein
MRSLSLLLVLAALTWAQETPPKNTQAIIEVKYQNPDRIAGLLGPTFGGNVRSDSNLHVIAVSGTPEFVAAVTAAIKKLDVPVAPEPDVELTVYLISGLAQGQATDDVPQDLAPTVKQLHGLFAYKSYKLADTLVLRGRASSQMGQHGTTGVLPGTSSRYAFNYTNVTVSSENPRVVHVSNLRFYIRAERTTQKDGNLVREYSDTPAEISTDLDLREGQKTVVGKSSINQAGDALILVIVPKIMD